jgi:ketosteroid isomerase-like protein
MERLCIFCHFVYFIASHHQVGAGRPKGSRVELQEISDRMEIQDLMVSYCYAIDSSDWDALDDVFTPDATIDYSEMVGVRGNLAHIKAFLAASLSQVVGFQHAISTTRLRFEGDVARGRTVCFNPITIKNAAGEKQVMFMGLWYRDTFVRTPQGWRIQDRYEERAYTHNVPPGLLPAD